MREDSSTQLGATVGQTVRVPCSECKLATKHSVIASVDNRWKTADVQGEDHYQVVQCMGCEAVSFRHESSNSDDYVQVEDEKFQLGITVRIYPPRLVGRGPLRDTGYLPPLIGLVYRETHQAICDGQSILAAIGLRALLESVCKEEGANGSTLPERLEQLLATNRISASQLELLDPIREMGNKAAHELRVVAPSQLEHACDVVEHLLQGTYILKLKAEHLKRRTKPRPEV